MLTRLWAKIARTPTSPCGAFGVHLLKVLLPQALLSYPGCATCQPRLESLLVDKLGKRLTRLTGLLTHLQRFLSGIAQRDYGAHTAVSGDAQHLPRSVGGSC